MKKDDPSEAEILRQKAETLLKKKTPEIVSPFSEIEMYRLIHELEVHQVELELQNDELRRARTVAEVAMSKYTSLYEFAPSGYFTLSALSEIIEVNIIGTQMLGKDRSKLINHRFTLFVSHDTSPVFNLFLEKIFQTKCKQSCEVKLLTNGDIPMYVLLTGIITEYQDQCNITMVDISERKQTEIRLRVEKERIKTILDLVGDPIFVKDNDHRITLANRAFYDIFCLNENSVIGFTLSEAVPENERQHFLKVDRQVLDSGITDIREEELTVGDITKTIITRKTCFIDETGNRFLVGSIHDITKRKQEEEELAFRANLLNQIGESVIATDTNGTITYWNKSAEKLYGWTPEEAIGRNLIDVIPASTTKEEAAEIFNSLTKGSKWSGEFLVKRKDGGSFPATVHDSPILNADGELTGVIGISSDITERKLAEAALLKSESEFRSLAESMPQIVWITDPAGMNIYFNQHWVDYTGLTLEESYGDGWNKPFHPDDQRRAWDAWQNATKHGATYLLECRLRRFDGEYAWWLIRGVPMFDADGTVLKWFGTCTDIREMKSAEAELIKAKEHAEESDRLKSVFLANMSHEIRTPMNGILGFAQLLKEPGLTGKEQQKYIRIIEKSGVRMLNIISDIVSISKIESRQMEVSISEINIHEKMEEIYDLFQPEIERSGLQLFVNNTLPLKEGLILTDGEKIFAILTNLLKNAIKFTTEGFIEFGYALVKTQDSESLQFFVKDTGEGIRREQMEIIFERFRQGGDLTSRYNEGAGLGLSISKAYVEMLGGKIWVESEPGKGSVFYFTIPYSAVPDTKIVSADIFSETGTTTQVENLKLLIVEDDESSEAFITAVIKQYCHEILNAINGVDAVAICRENLDIDLILMDIRMPEMNGYEATRHIRQFNKEVVIIAQTAYGLTGDREKAINAGCNDYISKPIDKDELLRLIQKYFMK
ncbi:MAG: PAS domain S-box protein [Bacteroidota bacterium]